MTPEIGKHIGSYKNASKYTHLFCAWFDDTHKLLKVLSVNNKSVVLETPHGGVLEVTNAKALYAPAGDEWKVEEKK